MEKYLNPNFVDFRIFEMAKSYLDKEGWFRSLGDMPVDKEGNPVPMFTYPALTMLRQIVTPNLKVFEYGCGYSTVWWDSMVEQVVSVDHDSKWIEKVRPKVSQKTTLINKPMYASVDGRHISLLNEFLDDKENTVQNLSPIGYPPCSDLELMNKEFLGYVSEILNYPKGYFDVIIIDGISRIFASWLASKQINENGIIIFDNSERFQFNRACNLLIDAGFVKIDFWGIGACLIHPWSTSFFVRNLETLKRNKKAVI